MKMPKELTTEHLLKLCYITINMLGGRGFVADQTCIKSALIKAREAGYREGVRAAAEYMDQWNSQTNIKHRLGDLLLYKFNLTTRRRPRINHGRLL